LRQTKGIFALKKGGVCVREGRVCVRERGRGSVRERVKPNATKPLLDLGLTCVREGGAVALEKEGVVAFEKGAYKR